MSKLDLSALIKATTALGLAVDNSNNQSFINGLTPSQKQLIISGVIQHFEFCYELSYKMLKRQLEADSPNPSAVDQYSFRDLLRTAAVVGLISDVELWFEFRRNRNITSHTYDEDKAESVYASAVKFQKEACYVLEKLQQRND